MSEHLFKTKTHGYGAYPTGWKGWAAIAGFVLAVNALAVFLIVVPVLSGEVPALWQVPVFVVLAVLLTWLFLRWVRARTDGEWRWRWSDKA